MSTNIMAQVSACQAKAMELAKALAEIQLALSSYQNDPALLSANVFAVENKLEETETAIVALGESMGATG